MAITKNLIDKFVEATNDSNNAKSESNLYGTVKIIDGDTFVQIDGSEILTPMPTVTTAKEGDRVKVEIKDHTAVIVGNMSSPSAMNSTVEALDLRVTSVYAEVGTFQTLLADKATIGELNAAKAEITELLAGKVTADELEAEIAKIDELIAKKVSTDIFDAKMASVDTLIADRATIGELSAAKSDIINLNAEMADIVSLVADKASVGELNAVKADIINLNVNKANITDLDAANANIGKLDASVGKIDALIFGSASGDVIQASFANAVIAQLGNAQIKSAMIESVSASKITAGDIITNNVRVMSEDGSLVISDETLQISDGTRVRVQIGKDAANDYSINIWDASGNLMFSKGGITDAAIKDAIIRNDMVAANANISASKLDIDSLFTEINNSSKTIKSTKVYLDEKGQTLDAAFTSMTTEVNGIRGTVESQGTQISVMQGQIANKIWQTDIDTTLDKLEIGGRNLVLGTAVPFTIDTTDNFVAVNRNKSYKLSPIITNNPKEFLLSLKDGRSLCFTFDINFPRCYKDSTLHLSRAGVYFQVHIKHSDGYSYYWYGTHSGPNIATNKHDSSLSSNSLVSFGENEESLVGTYSQYLTPSTTPSLSGFYANPDDYTVSISDVIVNFGGYTTGGSISNIKLEFGTQSTDWSPAPEDVEGEISTLSTKYSEVKQTVDGLSTTVASHTTEIANKADSSTVTAVNNKVSALEQNLDGFKTTVSNTYTTKTDFDNLKIGGRNLWITSSLIDAYDNQQGGYVSSPDMPAHKYLDVFIDTSGNDYLYFQLWNPNKIHNSTYKNRVAFFDANKTYISYVTLPYLLNEPYIKLLIPIPATAAYVKLAAIVGTTSGVDNDIKVKFEFGNKPTDWTPAPEDVEGEISTVSNKVSTLEQSVDGFKATVSSTYATKSDLDTTNSKLPWVTEGWVDATAYDPNYWIPFVANGSLPTYGYGHIAVTVALNSGTKPSWSIHDGGFSVEFDVEAKASGWGTSVQEAIINRDTYSYCYSSPVSYKQLGYGSKAILYLRGGGKYYVRTSWATTWTGFPDGYTWTSGDYSQSAPAYATRPTPEGYMYGTKTEINQLSDRITANVTETTALGTRMSTVEQKADGLTVSLTNTQNELNNLSIGGRNYLTNAKRRAMFSYIGSAGATINVDHAECVNGVYLVGAKDGSASVRIPNVINSNGCWTVSFDIKGSQSAAVGFFLDICDLGYWTVRTTHDNQWVRHSYTVNVTNYSSDVYNFVDFDNISWAYVFVRNIKVEKGNRATDWTPAPEDVDTGIANASKTATNYLNFSNGGLTVGNMTASTLGNNVLIDTDSVDIRNGTTVLASYKADTIELGKNSKSATIDLCSGTAQMRNKNDDTANDWNRLSIEARDSVEIESASFDFHGYTEQETYNSGSASVYAHTALPWDGDNPSARAEAGMSTMRYTSRYDYWENGIGLDDVGAKIWNSCSSLVSDSKGCSIWLGSLPDMNIPYGIHMEINGKTAVQITETALLLNAFASNTQFTPYYQSGDTIFFDGSSTTTTLYTSGFVTNGGKDVYFTIPLSKPIVGVSTVAAESHYGFQLRQNGNYTHGSTASAWAKPNTYEAYLDKGGNVVTIVAKFTTVTNAVNNAPIGIRWSGALGLDVAG